MIRFTALSLVFAAVAPAMADPWPQWRGPKGDGHSAETGIVSEWGPEKNLVWKTKLPGRGSSTPCIWKDRIFLTALDGKDRVLLCYDTAGQEKWKQPLGSNTKDSYRGQEGDDASASCSTDGKHVYALAGTGTMGAYDFDGKPVWQISLTEKYGKYQIQFGGHWTPSLYKGRLYLQLFHRGTQSLLALDAATGKELWRVERKGYGKGESPDTYASSFVWEGEGGPLLIAHGNDYTTAHKLEDGAEVWRVADLNPNMSGAWRFVSSPLVTPKLIVVPSCKNGPTVGINPVGAKGLIDGDNKAELWRLPSLTPDVPSPALVDDVVYLLSAGGELTGVDAAKGTILYKQSLAKQLHRASPVVVDGKLITLGMDGSSAVVKPGREFKLLATNTLPDKFYASPAIADGRIYLRGWNYLWAIGSK